MNDPDSNPAPDLDPQQEEQIRALLAENTAGPMPADVAARLDDTLAGLVAEREAGNLSDERTATGQVVPLRPRWMPRIAAGAAAVIVLGLGGIALVANLGGTQSSVESGATSTTDDSGGRSLLEDSASEAPVESAPGDTAAEQKAARDGLPRLQTASFTRDVQTLLRQQPALRAPAQSQERGGAAGTPSPTSPSQAPSADAACAGPSVTDGSTVTVARLDATTAAIVVHPAEDGKRLVEAWSCDGSRRLASTTVTP